MTTLCNIAVCQAEATAPRRQSPYAGTISQGQGLHERTQNEYECSTNVCQPVQPRGNRTYTQTLAKVIGKVSAIPAEEIVLFVSILSPHGLDQGSNLRSCHCRAWHCHRPTESVRSMHAWSVPGNQRSIPRPFPAANLHAHMKDTIRRMARGAQQCQHGVEPLYAGIPGNIIDVQHHLQTSLFTPRTLAH